MESKIEMSFIQTNLKKMLLPVMVISYCMLMISLVRLLSYIEPKILFKILLIVGLKTANIVLM